MVLMGDGDRENERYVAAIKEWKVTHNEWKVEKRQHSR